MRHAGGLQLLDGHTTADMAVVTGTRCLDEGALSPTQPQVAPVTHLACFVHTTPRPANAPIRAAQLTMDSATNSQGPQPLLA